MIPGRDLVIPSGVCPDLLTEARDGAAAPVEALGSPARAHHELLGLERRRLVREPRAARHGLRGAADVVFPPVGHRPVEAVAEPALEVAVDDVDDVHGKRVPAAGPVAVDDGALRKERPQGAVGVDQRRIAVPRGGVVHLPDEGGHRPRPVCVARLPPGLVPVQPPGIRERGLQGDGDPRVGVQVGPRVDPGRHVPNRHAFCVASHAPVAVPHAEGHGELAAVAEGVIARDDPLGPRGDVRLGDDPRLQGAVAPLPDGLVAVAPFDVRKPPVEPDRLALVGRDRGSRFHGRGDVVRPHPRPVVRHGAPRLLDGHGELDQVGAVPDVGVAHVGALGRGDGVELPLVPGPGVDVDGVEVDRGCRPAPVRGRAVRGGVGQRVVRTDREDAAGENDPAGLDVDLVELRRDLAHTVDLPGHVLGPLGDLVPLGLDDLAADVVDDGGDDDQADPPVDEDDQPQEPVEAGEAHVLVVDIRRNDLVPVFVRLEVELDLGLVVDVGVEPAIDRHAGRSVHLDVAVVEREAGLARQGDLVALDLVVEGARPAAAAVLVEDLLLQRLVDHPLHDGLGQALREFLPLGDEVLHRRRVDDDPRDARHGVEQHGQEAGLDHGREVHDLDRAVLDGVGREDVDPAVAVGAPGVEPASHGIPDQAGDGVVAGHEDRVFAVVLDHQGDGGGVRRKQRRCLDVRRPDIGEADLEDIPVRDEPHVVHQDGLLAPALNMEEQGERHGAAVGGIESEPDLPARVGIVIIHVDPDRPRAEGVIDGVRDLPVVIGLVEAVLDQLRRDVHDGFRRHHDGDLAVGQAREVQDEFLVSLRIGQGLQRRRDVEGAGKGDGVDARGRGAVHGHLDVQRQADADAARQGGVEPQVEACRHARLGDLDNRVGGVSRDGAVRSDLVGDHARPPRLEKDVADDFLAQLECRFVPAGQRHGAPPSLDSRVYGFLGCLRKRTRLRSVTLAPPLTFS
ncbi:MAG: hypothetical protein A4E67_01528 [Syntrophaceae bacterium PtaB.Bin038]|nr:MAG: hypothetical protein A4E67_01528 [Syntrophaceae bacterium PtaB.Bin038]